MEPEFITYQKFNDLALAQDLAQMLEQNNIPYETEEESAVFDPSFALNNAKVDYAIKIRSADFERVNKLLEENAANEIEGVEEDHYLFGFTDEELLEVLEKADEWSAFDVALARKILADRGNDLSDAEVAKIHEQRIEELKTTEQGDSSLVTWGYVTAFLGGVIGIFIGWYIFSSKKVLPDGEQLYSYSEKERKDGKRIFYLSIIIAAIAVILRIIREVPWE